MPRLYHFTSAERAPVILREGVLRTTESNVSMLREHAGPDVVWLLDTPDLDGLPHGLAGSRYDKTRVRFTVDVPRARAERWTDWVKRHPLDDVWMPAFLRVGGGMAAAKHWWVTERSIAARFWIDVTDMQTGEALWRP